MVALDGFSTGRMCVGINVSPMGYIVLKGESL